VFNSGSFTTGVIATDYSVNIGNLIPGLSNVAASQIADDLNANSDGRFEADSATFSSVVTVEWADFEDHVLGVLSQTTTSGSLDPITINTVVSAVQPVAMEPGEGFEALETIVVDGGEDADLFLTDVYGSFALDVTAAVDA